MGLEHSHAPSDISERLSDGPSASYASDALYGAIDGTVTTFAIVAGLAGASLAGPIVLILGVANLLADGFSMAVSAAVATRSERTRRDRLRQMEHRHLKAAPDGERLEVEEILRNFGLEGEVLIGATNAITANEDRWVEFMLTQEHGLSLSERSPLRAGLVTFAGFALAGAVPLAPFVFLSTNGMPLSIALTGLTFALTGAISSHLNGESVLWGGIRVFLIGSIAAGVAYGVGFFLDRLLGAQ